MDCFFQEMNAGLKVTIKIKVKDNVLLQSLQTLTKANLVDSTNILSLISFMWKNCLQMHIKMVNL